MKTISCEIDDVLDDVIPIPVYGQPIENHSDLPNGRY